VQTLLQWLPSCAPVRVAEVGIGSGCVALSILAERPLARVVASDVSQRALDVAAANARRLRVESQLELRLGSVLEPMEGMKFDAVVSNPPYIADGDPTVDGAVNAHEPHVALYSGCAQDALKVAREVIAQASQALRAGGWVAVEVGWRSAAEACDAMRAHGLVDVAALKDFAGIERVVVARRTLRRSEH